MIDGDDLIDRVIRWAEEADPKKVDRWRNFLYEYLKLGEWNEKAIEDFWMWGVCGFNDKRLHDEYTTEEFYSEVLYCSDRMNIDRLFRCHSRYRNLKKNQ
jgi:hypothetical protein